jgi:hypothetical protein
MLQDVTAADYVERIIVEFKLAEVHSDRGMGVVQVDAEVLILKAASKPKFEYRLGGHVKNRTPTALEKFGLGV